MTNPKLNFVKCIREGDNRQPAVYEVVSPDILQYLLVDVSQQRTEAIEFAKKLGTSKSTDGKADGKADAVCSSKYEVLSSKYKVDSNKHEVCSNKEKENSTLYNDDVSLLDVSLNTETVYIIPVKDNIIKDAVTVTDPLPKVPQKGISHNEYNKRTFKKPRFIND